jgi:hypothetical protein
MADSDDEDDRPPVPESLDLSSLPDISGLDPARLTFTSLHSEIFAPTCSTSLCHSSTAFGNAHLTGLDMTLRDSALTQLMRGSIQWTGWQRIEPGNPARSYLMAKLIRHPAIDGTLMPPPPAQRLSEETLARIAEWIRRGAPDD